jgi:hypothetical protein
VNDYEVITAAGRPDLIDSMRDLGASPWPEFLGHDEVVNGRWNDLYERFPDFQFALAGRERGNLIAVGNCLPIRWDGDPSTLPARGIDARSTASGTSASTSSPIAGWSTAHADSERRA